jgi:GYF domain 2
MSKLYKRPVISTVFECIGAAAVIAGVFAFIAAWVDTSSGQPGAPAAIAGAVCVIVAAVYYGIGQVIDFLGRASHRSDQIGVLLEEGILPQIKALETRLASPQRTAPPPPDAEYFYSKEGKEEGPFSATELQTFRAKGVIGDTTPVFRTGDKDWLPLAQSPGLAKKR